MTDRPQNDDERRERTLEAKRRWARKARAEKKGKKVKEEAEADEGSAQSATDASMLMPPEAGPSRSMSRSTSVSSNKSGGSNRQRSVSPFVPAHSPSILLEAARSTSNNPDLLAQSWPAPQVQSLAPPPMIRSASMPAPNRANVPPPVSYFTSHSQHWQPQAQAPWMQFPDPVFSTKSSSHPFPPSELAPLPTLDQLTSNRAYHFQPQDNHYDAFTAQTAVHSDHHQSSSQPAVNSYDYFHSSLPISYSAGPSLNVQHVPLRPTSDPPSSAIAFNQDADTAAQHAIREILEGS